MLHESSIRDVLETWSICFKRAWCSSVTCRIDDLAELSVLTSFFAERVVLTPMEMLQSGSSQLSLDPELHLGLPLSVVLRIISIEHDLFLGLGLGRLRLHVAHLGLEQLSGPTSGR